MFPTEHTGSTGACFFHADAKAERRFHEFKKLYAMARDYVLSQPHMMVLGEDPVVNHLLSSAGFAPHDIAVLRFSTKGKFVTALCVPTRLWKNPETRATILEIKRDARRARTSCILVPQKTIRAPVRAARSRLIARARSTAFSRKQVMMVMNHLDQVRIATVSEAAGQVLGHDDPVGVVLALIAEGLVTHDRSSPLGPETYISARAEMKKAVS